MLCSVPWQASFIVIDATQAWCDEQGQVVSFTNLQVSQVRDPLGGATGEPCAAGGGDDFIGY